MNLDEQIAKLQALKAKVHKYEELKEVVAKYELPDVVEFIDRQIEAISNPTPAKPEAPKPVAANAKPEKAFVPLNDNDPIRFALKYRQAQGKEVIVKSKDGTVPAKVVGVKAPHIIVETDTGHTVQVPPTDIEGL